MPNRLSSGPHHVLGYLGRYTHRVAITNHHLVAFQNSQVTFRWKDYAHRYQKRMKTLSTQEFLRRFLLHVLLHHFVRICSFGFLANCRRALLLPLLPLSAMCHSYVASGNTLCLGC